MSVSTILGTLTRCAALALGAAGCGDKMPGEAEALEIAQKALARYGMPLELKAGAGTRVRMLHKGYDVWRVPVRGALRVAPDVYWVRAGGALLEQIGDYVVPGQLTHFSELTLAQRRRVASGDAALPGIEAVPAGSIYVFEGFVSWRRNGKELVLDEWLKRRRGTCADADVKACYSRHGIPPAI